MTSNVTVRPVAPADRAGWDPLWQGYLRFYGAKLAPEVTDMTWSRLLDPNAMPIGLVAVDDDRLVGLAHVVTHRSSWALKDYCYLEDLFVDPARRGHGVGRKLIQAVYDLADRIGAARTYWHTQEFNTEARRLYEVMARRVSFVQYRR
jgi:GNAT superfamily N-acetyltransferase